MKNFKIDPIPTSDYGDQKPECDIPFTVRRRVNWGDSDTAEIAYTGSFIPFAIDALEVWYEAILGFNFYELKKTNLGNPAVSLHFDFHAPLVVGDRFDTEVFVDHIGVSSITHRFKMIKIDGNLICTASFTAALVKDLHTSKIKSQPFPDHWRERIEGYIRECELRKLKVRTRREVIDFWFKSPNCSDRGEHREIWFARQNDQTSEFDLEIKTNFLETIEAAAKVELDNWRHSLDGILALCILLDQFPRNIYRGTARAFMSDKKILSMVKHAIQADLHKNLKIIPGKFLLLPFQHSENMADQDEGAELFSVYLDSELGNKSYNSMIEHRKIIQDYGRFPHRNLALNRTSTPAEEIYLKDDKAGF